MGYEDSCVLGHRLARRLRKLAVRAHLKYLIYVSAELLKLLSGIVIWRWGAIIWRHRNIWITLYRLEIVVESWQQETQSIHQTRSLFELVTYELWRKATSRQIMSGRFV